MADQPVSRPQEALLPDTKAIRYSTVEMGRYRTGYLVRYKNLEGHTLTQQKFKDPEEATRFFWQCVEKLKQAIGKGKHGDLPKQ